MAGMKRSLFDVLLASDMPSRGGAHAGTCLAARRAPAGLRRMPRKGAVVIEFLMVPGAPTPVAPFSHATVAEGWLFVTGQMPTNPEHDEPPLPDGIKAQTCRVIDNLMLVLGGCG